MQRVSAWSFNVCLLRKTVKDKKHISTEDCNIVFVIGVNRSLWSCVHATQEPRRRVDAVVSVYGSASGFSERTNHSPCGCVASTEGYDFWEAHVRTLVDARRDARRVRKDVRGP